MSDSLRTGELGPLCIQTHPSLRNSCVNSLCLTRRRKQRRGRYNGSYTHSGAARSSQMSRAWWSSSLLSDGACPIGREPVLSCCTAGTSHCCSTRGQPPRAGTHQAAQRLGMATGKPAPSTKDPKVLGHVENRSMGAREALSLRGQMKQCSAKCMGEGRANRAGPGASVDGAGIPRLRCPGHPWADC